MENERFSMPSQDELIAFAQKLEVSGNPETIAAMAGMAQVLLDRLQDNNDIFRPSIKEIEFFSKSKS